MPGTSTTTQRITEIFILIYHLDCNIKSMIIFKTVKIKNLFNAVVLLKITWTTSGEH